MRIPKLIIGTLILVSIGINFANVVGRYLFFTPILWAEEIMIHIMIWLVFTGAIVVAWEGKHLRMDILSTLLPQPWKNIVSFISVLSTIVVCGFVAWQSWSAVGLLARLGQKSPVAEVPMVIPHSALLCGFVLMMIAVAVRFRAQVRGDLTSEFDSFGDMEPEPKDGNRS